MPQVLMGEEVLKYGVLSYYSAALKAKEQVSLSFTYKDLKYVIVEKQTDFYELVNEIDSWELEDAEKYTLLSKIIVWENTSGDF